MPTLDSNSLGSLAFTDGEVVRFPLGLPGFEGETSFLPVSKPESEPLVFLQSVATPSLFFLTIPLDLVDSRYELKLLEEYRQVLGIDSGGAPLSPGDLWCLGIVCMPEGALPTVNLLGPIVIHRGSKRGVQAIRDDARYSAARPLFPGSECS